MTPSVLHQPALVVGDEGPLAAGDHGMSLGLEPFLLAGQAARVFRIDLAVPLEGAPVGRDALAALRFVFGGGVRGDAGEDAGRDAAGDGRSVPLGERIADLVYSDEPAGPHPPHDLVDLARRRDHHRSHDAPALGDRRDDRLDPRQAMVIRQLLAKRFLRFHVVSIGDFRQNNTTYHTLPWFTEETP